MLTPLTKFAASAATMAPRSVTVLGATGSVGTSTLDLIGRHPELFQVKAITAHNNVAKLADLARAHDVEFAAIGDPDKAQELRDALGGSGIKTGAGANAVIEAAEREADIVVSAIVGAAGLAPTLAAIERGTTIALANKESLVCAGKLVMERARQGNVAILPVDSEHSAIMQSLPHAQCIADPEIVSEIVLTASGGPFRTWTAERMRAATREDALNHPVWDMGAKITIDSATMMNKALELIEAHHLFATGPDRLGVLVHPQSIVHGLVRYVDGSMVAQMGTPDMRTPIAVALAWPTRIASPSAPLDLAALGQLTFETPDPDKFPALRLVKSVMRDGGCAGTIFNAANEVAVGAFLEGRILFGDIVAVTENVLDELASSWTEAPAALDTALACDEEARRLADVAIARQIKRH
jgi:1-deoxy-D-xylulose-5-phosphate reductoisomerase